MPGNGVCVFTGLWLTPLRWCRLSAVFWSSELTVPHSSTPTHHALTLLSPSPFHPRARTHWPWVRHIHTHTHRHLLVTHSCSVTLSLLHSARRLQSAKKDMQCSTQKEWWSPRCRRANPAACHSSDELCASSASSPCPSPSHSPCPSPRPSIAQALFRTKLQLVDLAGSECVGKGASALQDVPWICKCHRKTGPWMSYNGISQLRKYNDPNMPNCRMGLYSYSSLLWWVNS